MEKPKIGEPCNGCGICCRTRVCYNGAYIQRLVKELGETVIDDPTVCRECEFYDISSFIKKDERGLLAPNVIAIQNLAYKIMANK